MSSKLKLRETNIELLRIISMILIILFHYVYKSQYQFLELTPSTYFIKVFYFFGELGVNLFILITGYYLCKTKAKIKKIILLILEVMFYHFLLYFIANIVGYDITGETIRAKILLFFPIITNVYWFVAAYLLVYILSPFYNILIHSMTKRNYQKFLITNALLWSIIPTFFGLFYGNSESIIYYNRFIWLSFMYFIGAYIRLYDIKIFSTKKKSILIFFITFLIMFVSIYIIDLYKGYFAKLGTYELAYLWTPNNIFMLLLSISMFKYFSLLKIKNSNFINKISTTTLGIYLLHDGYLTYYMWPVIFKNNVNIYKENWYIYALVSTLIIFVVGVIIDLIRQFIEKNIVVKVLNFKIWSKMHEKIRVKAISIIDKFL